MRDKATKATKKNRCVKKRFKAKRNQIYNENRKCRFCDKICATRDEAISHESDCDQRNSENILNTADGKLRFICKVCNQLFKHQTGLKKHEVRHEAPGGFICSECNERFLTDAERSLHRETIHKLFKCMICNVRFTSEESYISHINEKHQGRDRIYVVCTECGAQFRQPNQLKLHNASKCGTVRCFECEKCGSKFMNQNTLNAHILIHVGEKKYLCNFCGNSYLSRGQLKNHIRSHTKEKPFKCDVCDKAFSHRESLVTHSSLHTGIKPYLCENCDSRFSCIGNLIKHRKARPHTCGLPQFCKNTKCAPRASSKNVGSLTMQRTQKTRRAHTKCRDLSVPELLESRLELTVKDEENQDDCLKDSFSQHHTENNDAQLNTTYISTDSQEFHDNFDDLLILKPKTKSSEIPEHDSNFITTSSDTAYEKNWISESHEPQIQSVEINESGTVTYFLIKNTDDENIVLNQHHQTSNIILPNLTEIREITLSEPNELSSSGEIIILDGNEYSTDAIIEELNESDIEANVKNETSFDCSEMTSDFIESNLNNVGLSNDQNENIDEINHFDENFNSDDDNEFLSNDEHISSNKDVQEFTEPDETYQCNECPGQFKYQKSFLKHMENYHQKNASQICPKTPKKHNKLAYSCKYCDKSYTSEKLLNKHIICHGEDGKLIYRCVCCPIYFETVEVVQAHQKEAHMTKLTCNICSKTFKDPESVGAHIRYVHTKVNSSVEKKKYTYVCTKCGKKFNSRVALSDHERGDCGRSPIYKCNDCNKFYHSAGSLKTHQLIHAGILAHLCKFCGKAFRTQGQVKVHERSHNGDKPFKCDFCPKSFAHRESLLTHLSLHTGIKRFMCQGCGSRFSCISNLQAHRRSHKVTCGTLPKMTKPVYTGGTILALQSTNEEEQEETIGLEKQDTVSN